ncbi:unnamed protein product [Coffea canephora]|uniref:Cupin type-1 domain-containing protein n=1 Tax=Coffea canephora TaxID=49390 RepID=A0A068VAD9_COFCA|nr:unnamed protein product [Coffea canephora]
MAKSIVLLSLIPSSFIYVGFAVDPQPLQDFCVRDPRSSIRLVCSSTCKNPTLVTADDFSFSGLHKAGNTSNDPFRSNSNVVDVNVYSAPRTLALILHQGELIVLNFTPEHPRLLQLLKVLGLGQSICGPT